MNENNLNQNDENKYVASQNLNTVIDNPQINVNSATSVNVQDLGYSNQVDQANNSMSNTFSNSSFEEKNQVNNVVNNYSSSINSNNNATNTMNSNVNDISNSVENSVSSVNYSVNNTNNGYSYQPTLEEKKEKKDNYASSLLHSGEFKVMIFILFILCLFLLVMPYVYDFIKNTYLMR